MSRLERTPVDRHSRGTVDTLSHEPNHHVTKSDSSTGGAILTVAFRRIGPVCLLTLRGELNAASIAALEVQIDQIGASDSGVVLLDLAGVQRLDEVGRSVLVGLDQYVRALGGRLTVMCGDGQVAQALADTALDIEGRHWSVDQLISDLDREVRENQPWSDVHQREEA